MSFLRGEALLLLLALVATVHAVETAPVQVLRVIDGDTIEVAATLGGKPLPTKVRLLYLDTPEPRGKKAMPEGDMATAALDAQLPDATMVKLWGPGDELEQSGGEPSSRVRQHHSRPFSSPHLCVVVHRC